MFSKRNKAPVQPNDTAQLTPMAPHEQHLGVVGAFRLYWSELLWMAALGAVALGVYMAPPAPSRSFPIEFLNGELAYPEFGYPLRKNIIPIWAAALIAGLVPMFFFLLFAIRHRSFEAFITPTMAVLMSLIVAATFQVFLKWLIGGLRPHFLTVCAPRVQSPGSGDGWERGYYTRDICTGDEKEINDSLESFPSGHSTAAWAGLLFLSIWFNAHMKIFADYRSSMIKMTFFFAPLLGAVLICGSLTIDEYHNWWDTVAGAIIGTTTALAAYRMTYASIWNYRINHIALPANPHGIWSAPPSHGMKGLTLNQEYGIRRDMSNWHEMRAASGV